MVPAARHRGRASRWVPVAGFATVELLGGPDCSARSASEESVVNLQNGAFLRRRALPGYSAERETHIYARVAKLADALDLGSSGRIALGGSTPPSRTTT